MRLNVGTVASRVVVTAPRDMPVAAAARLMREHHVGTLVVVDAVRDSPRPLGIVTDRDLVMEVLAQGVDPKLIAVGDLLARPLVTAREDDALFDAIQAMNQHGVRRVVVVDSEGHLAALLSMDDVIGVLAEELSGLSKAIEVEERTERVQRPALATAD
jgi:CBS domain-containing protein